MPLLSLVENPAVCIFKGSSSPPCAGFATQLFFLGSLRAWRSSCMSQCWSGAASPPRFLLSVPFGAIMCYKSSSAGRRSPPVPDELWNWLKWGFLGSLVHNWLEAVSEQTWPVLFSTWGWMYPKISVIRVKEGLEGDEFSSPQAASGW